MGRVIVDWCWYGNDLGSQKVDMVLPRIEMQNKARGRQEGQEQQPNRKDFRTSVQTRGRLGATTDTCSTMSLCQEQLKTSSRKPQYT